VPAELKDQPLSIDRKVFRALFDLHFNALCAFSSRYVDAESVEDIVQDVFIAFWHKRGNFNHIHAVKSYLYKSVRNKCLNYIRDEAVRQKHLATNIDTNTEFANHVIEEEAFNQLYSEIKNLPKASQQIMLLALNGMKNPEIAEELSISVNTVKTQKKIAYAKLKDRISPYLHSILLTL
jgi:RNA polymerase sigma-70 factor (family 1)